MADPVLWGPERSISGVNLSAFTPLKDGSFLAVWASGRDILGRVYNADGSPKAGAFTVGTNTDGLPFIDDLTVSTLSDGRFAVAWVHDGGVGTRIRSKIFNADTTADSDIFDIGSGTALSAPRITPLADGKYAVSYKDATQIRSVLDPESIASNDVVLHARGTSANQSVATLTNGNYVTVAPVLNDDVGIDVRAFLREPDGTVTSVVLTHQDDLPAPLSVTALANGKFLVTWTDGIEPGNRLKARVYTATGAADGAEILIYQSDDHRVAASGVQALAGGGFAVTFDRFDDIESDILTASFSAAGQSIVAPTLVGQHTDGSQFGSALMVLADGRYVVSWIDLNTDPFRAAMQIYDPRSAAVSWSGTDGAEQFAGTRFNDDLNGGDGDDALFGGDGNDVLTGGPGIDTLSGGAGNDTYHAGALDRIVELAGGGIDTIVTGANLLMRFMPHLERVIVTGTAAVSITGNDEANSIYGNAGYDRFYGEAGNDIVYGRSGNDTIYGGIGNDRLYGEVGNDYLRGDTGNDTLYGSAGNDKLIGDDSDDRLYGDAGNDVLIGGNHNDKLYGGAGKDVLTGGSGRDIFVFNTALNRSTNVDRITDFSVPYDTIWLDNRYMAKLGTGTEVRPGRLNSKSLAFDSAKDADDYLVYVRKTGALLYDVDGSGSKAAVAIAILKPGLKLTYADFQII